MYARSSTCKRSLKQQLIKILFSRLVFRETSFILRSHDRIHVALRISVDFSVNDLECELIRCVNNFSSVYASDRLNHCENAVVFLRVNIKLFVACEMCLKVLDQFTF